MLFDDDDQQHFGELDPENLEEALEYYQSLWQQDFTLLVSFRHLVSRMVRYLPDSWFIDEIDDYKLMLDSFQLFNMTHPMSHPDKPKLVKDLDGEWVDIEDFVRSVLDK